MMILWKVFVLLFFCLMPVVQCTLLIYLVYCICSDIGQFTEAMFFCLICCCIVFVLTIDNGQLTMDIFRSEQQTWYNLHLTLFFFSS
jgi:hypothetical protein